MRTTALRRTALFTANVYGRLRRIALPAFLIAAVLVGLISLAELTGLIDTTIDPLPPSVSIPHSQAPHPDSRLNPPSNSAPSTKPDTTITFSDSQYTAIARHITASLTLYGLLGALDADPRALEIHFSDPALIHSCIQQAQGAADYLEATNSLLYPSQQAVISQTAANCARSTDPLAYADNQPVSDALDPSTPEQIGNSRRVDAATSVTNLMIHALDPVLREASRSTNYHPITIMEAAGQDYRLECAATANSGALIIAAQTQGEQIRDQLAHVADVIELCLYTTASQSISANLKTVDPTKDSTNDPNQFGPDSHEP